MIVVTLGEFYNQNLRVIESCRRCWTDFLMSSLGLWVLGELTDVTPQTLDWSPAQSSPNPAIM